MANEVVTVARLSARDDTTRAFRSVQNNMQATRKQSQALNQQFRFMRGGMGQVGHQVQDIAVQLQMGTNAMIVFGQQGSQIASLFGPQGAMIGAVLAVGAAIAVAFSRDAKKGEDALKDLTERTKEFASEMQELSETTRLFLVQDASKRFSDLLESTGGATQKLKENRAEQQKLNDIIAVHNNRQRDLNTVIEAGKKTKSEATEELQELQKEEVILARTEEDLRQQFKKTRTELTLLKAGRNPYIEVEDGLTSVRKEHKQFLDQLIFQNEIFGKGDIDQFIAGLEQQLNSMEGLNAEEKEQIETQIALARSIRESAAAREASEDAADREFSSFLQHQEALDRETDALEKNRIARERKSLLTEEEAQAESFTRRRELIDKALKKEGADKTMLAMLSMRLAQEEAEFREQVERRKMNAHDLFIDTAISGLERFKEALGDNDKQALELAERIDRLADNSMQAFTDSFYDAIAGAESFRDAFKDMARSIVEDLSKMLIQYYITQQIFGAITSMFPGGGTTTSSGGGGTGNFAGTFEGGGFTGYGARSGGIDGKGGFPAILHPNETVLDHTKGQGQGVTIVQNINVTTGVQQTVRAEIANLLPQISNAAKSAVADARMRGGGFSKAMVGS